MPSEKDIEKKIRKAMENRGAFTMKLHGSPMSAGYPDIIACYRGRFLGLEVKKPNTRHTVTPRQRHFLDAIAAAGGVTAVVTSVEEAMLELDRSELL